jgi:5-formyltetrahydrofolate cyclo-ligase
VPALAATPDGHRLGYGKGFYDATLPDVCPPALAIAVVYSFQLLAELPVESHDHRCDLVATDAQVFFSTARVSPSAD